MDIIYFHGPYEFMGESAYRRPFGPQFASWGAQFTNDHQQMKPEEPQRKAVIEFTKNPRVFLYISIRIMGASKKLVNN